MRKILLSAMIICSCHCYGQENKDFQHLQARVVQVSNSKIENQLVDSLTVIDSLKTELFLANLKLAKITYYLKIVNRKPSQIIYLKGWIRRALQ